MGRCLSTKKKKKKKEETTHVGHFDADYRKTSAEGGTFNDRN